MILPVFVLAFAMGGDSLDLSKPWVCEGRRVHIWFDEEEQWETGAVLDSITPDRVYCRFKGDRQVYYLDTKDCMTRIAPTFETVTPTSRHHFDVPLPGHNNQGKWVLPYEFVELATKEPTYLMVSFWITKGTLRVTAL